jgi:hypothetical protein
MWVFNNGTNVVDVTTHMTSLTLGSALPAASGGTGLTSPGASGNVLTSNGTAWVSSATAATFPTGGIIMWSGTIATIPSGWALCDGNNGTPNLVNRFIICASQDDGGVAKTTITGSPLQTGGSKDAIVVSHTHTASVTDPGHAHEIVSSGRGRSSPGNDPVFFNTKTRSGTASFEGTSAANVSANNGTSSETTGITVGISTEGSSGTNANLPPYYALAYIMKT